MADADLILELGRLAQASATAAEAQRPPAELAETYAQLRAEAVALNLRYRWATDEELASELPALDGLMAIEALERAVEPDAGATARSDRLPAARLADALRRLAGWTTGVRLAQETLRDVDAD